MTSHLTALVADQHRADRLALAASRRGTGLRDDAPHGTPAVDRARRRLRLRVAAAR